MSDIAVVAGVAAGVGSTVTALSGVAAYLINRGRTEGSLKTDIKNLTETVKNWKEEAAAELTELRSRADQAHARIDSASSDHHSLRELIAKEYVTYERMRELKTEVMAGISKMETSQRDALVIIHGRLDALISAVSHKALPRPHDV